MNIPCYLFFDDEDIYYMDFKNYFLLREVLDNIPTNMPIKWHPSPQTGKFEDKYIAYFQINNSTYYISFTKAVQFPSKTRVKKGLFGYYVLWDMYRGTDPQASLDQENGQSVSAEKEKKSLTTSGNFKRTHKGDGNLKNTISVLKYVLSGIYQFVTTLKPALISYKAADTQLSRVYRMFADKHADELGYDFHGRHLVRKDVLEKWGETIDWFLKNADQVL